MNLVEDDVGKKVELRNGDIRTIREWKDGSTFPAGDFPFSWQVCGKYLQATPHPLDIVKFASNQQPREIGGFFFEDDDLDDVEEETDNKHVPHCTVHSWVGTGFPGGDVWCKICDVTYNEYVHGDSGL